MRTGRPKKELILSSEERTKLEMIIRRPKTSQSTALRAAIVLDCASGMSNTGVARKRRVTVATVGKWRQRFVAQRLGALGDAPRPGQPRKITDAKIEEVISRTLEKRPPTATHWSTRSMAKASGLTQNAIVRIWRAFGLKPHLQESFKLSTDPFFVEKVRDIVGLYLNPPEQTRAIVLCVDEKSQVQALDRSQPILPCAQARLSGAPMTTTAMGLPRFLPPLTLPLARSSDAVTGAIATRSSCAFSNR